MELVSGFNPRLESTLALRTPENNCTWHNRRFILETSVMENQGTVHVCSLKNACALLTILKIGISY
ncbi:hypothetical protein K7I13_06815 [Brucepastera parasyntrophica]|uniref:hypothetical protein n=1 Tax=Brucepastera parasyntrophica TaxID=2880008 RepID=UPI0021098209|nr:hypothetical protein [Brucepastera parasyntrophica]ULQ60959.1 hypothetical protein K7I13_06815 [Brucepastera parasyntrophica]